MHATLSARPHRSFAVRRRPQGLALRLLAAVGLAVDADIHVYLAPTQPPGGAGQLSQVTLFYGEAVAASVAVLLLLLAGARWTFAMAALVAASALVAVLVYRYVDLGSFGPLPDMYEPFWYPSKTATALAETLALLAAVAGLLLPRRRRD